MQLMVPAFERSLRPSDLVVTTLLALVAPLLLHLGRRRFEQIEVL